MTFDILPESSIPYCNKRNMKKLKKRSFWILKQNFRKAKKQESWIRIPMIPEK